MNKVLRRLDSIHSKLVDTISPVEDPLFSRSPADNEWSIAEIFKHPFFGEIDGTATISFIGYHELRHYKQIREVIKKLDRGSGRV
jgi:hypothetical protein